MHEKSFRLSESASESAFSAFHADGNIDCDSDSEEYDLPGNYCSRAVQTAMNSGHTTKAASRAFDSAFRLPDPMFQVSRFVEFF
jgi:hypothetical protein